MLINAELYMEYETKEAIETTNECFLRGHNAS